ncbi:MAG: hypothetical protein COV45_04050 [Deltaproteobacteria bacterium CG11_big_fil_rev_8_21_14_0_20_47_16]|nr:MAG: hypothetical protein COV45_04050 [Deltaproteobacteria bacterium CG11_big_fil_rev_8_21_14_0_20_47_16]
MISIFLTILIGAFWGGSFVAIQAVVAQFPPLVAVFWRIALATVVMAPIVCVKRKPLWPQHSKRLAMVSGALAMGIPWCLLFWAEQHVNGALGAIMNATVPVFVLLLSPLYHPKAVTRQQWLGVGMAFMGIVVVFMPGLQTGGASNAWAVAALVGMAIAYANGLLFAQRFLRGLAPTTASLWQGVGGASFVAVVALSSGYSLWNPDLILEPIPRWGILYLAVFSTAIANIILLWLLQQKGSVTTSLVTFLIPLFSIIIEWMYFGTEPSRTTWAGTVMVLMGLYIVQFWRQRKKVRMDAPILSSASGDET